MWWLSVSRLLLQGACPCWSNSHCIIRRVWSWQIHLCQHSLLCWSQRYFTQSSSRYQDCQYHPCSLWQVVNHYTAMVFTDNIINIELEEDGVKLHLCLIDTPGFGDRLNREQEYVLACWIKKTWLKHPILACNLFWNTLISNMKHIMKLKSMLGSVTPSMILVYMLVYTSFHPLVTGKKRSSRTMGWIRKWLDMCIAWRNWTSKHCKSYLPRSLWYLLLPRLTQWLLMKRRNSKKR